ncbi:MAG: hypothetical protein WD077_06680 [Bacteroidia bacterium]
MKSIALLTLFLATLINGCKKDLPEPQLPPYTQEGKNIFACKINGEVFVAEGVMDKNTMSPKGTDNNYMVWGNDTIVEIRAVEKKPTEASVSVDFVYTLIKDTFELNQKENSVARISIPVENYVFAESIFKTTDEHKGWVQVKYFQNNILAGTFEFTAIDDRGEIIHVTDGRFDFFTK